MTVGHRRGLGWRLGRAIVTEGNDGSAATAARRLDVGGRLTVVVQIPQRRCPQVVSDVVLLLLMMVVIGRRRRHVLLCVRRGRAAHGSVAARFGGFHGVAATATWKCARKVAITAQNAIVHIAVHVLNNRYLVHL